MEAVEAGDVERINPRELQSDVLFRGRTLAGKELEEMSRDFEPTLKDRFVLWLGPRLIYPFIATFYRLNRKEDLNLKAIAPLLKEGKGWLLGMYHQNMFMAVHRHHRWGIFTMVSASKDGDMIHTYMALSGNYAIRGSTSKFGRRAMKKMIQVGRRGHPICMVPDGPRGPRLKFQSGIVTLASFTGLPIVPYHNEATKQWTIERAWDKQRVPRPFGTVVTSWGDPIYVPRQIPEAEFPEWERRVEAAMVANMNRCDARIEELRKKGK